MNRTPRCALLAAVMALFLTSGTAASIPSTGGVTTSVSIDDAVETLFSTCPMSQRDAIPGAVGFAEWGLGGSPVWMVGAGAPPAHDESGPPSTAPSDVPPHAGVAFVGPMSLGWYTKVLWAIEGGTTEPVTLGGSRLDDGRPVWFGINQGRPTTSPVLDPLQPAIPIQHGDWREFPSFIYFPETGCYVLEARWADGVWRAQIPFVAPEGGAGLATPFAGPDTTQIQVRTREGSGPLPHGCDPEAVAKLLIEFIDAFNRGDEAALTRVFPAEAASPTIAEAGKFNWFSVARRPGRRHDADFTAETRDQLLRYVAERHRHGERWRLLQVEVGRSWHQGVDVAFDIEREADEVPAYVAGGTGAIDCQNRTIFAWAMGDRELLPDSSFATPSPVLGDRRL